MSQTLRTLSSIKHWFTVFYLFCYVQGLHHFNRPCALGGEGALWIQQKYRTYLPPGRELCQMAPFCLARISSAFVWHTAMSISSSGNRSWRWSYFPSTSRSSLGAPAAVREYPSRPANSSKLLSHAAYGSIVFKVCKSATDLAHSRFANSLLLVICVLGVYKACAISADLARWAALAPAPHRDFVAS